MLSTNARPDVYQPGIHGDQEDALADELDSQLSAIGERLDKLFQEQVSAKSTIEKRWVDDLRRYNGQYDPEVLERIQANKGSEAYLNLVRVKCNVTEGRLAEMLLPTDDRNWSIRPTPKSTDAAGQPVDEEAAQKACDGMLTVMDDQLAEAGYNSVIRQVIHNQVVYGTGVLKGPVLRNRRRTRFVNQSGQWLPQVEENHAPGMTAVSLWDFFPDMRVSTLADAEFVFERHRMVAKAVRELAALPGFIKSQVAKLLDADPPASFSGMVGELDAAVTGSARPRYELLEYSGPLTFEEMTAILTAMTRGLDEVSRQRVIRAAGLDERHRNLTSIPATVWVSGGLVLKAVVSMLDDGELMYDAVPFERDENSIFGFGVPYLMRHTASAGSSAYRMILDNARASVGPIVVSRAGKVRAPGGDFSYAPFKHFEVTDPNMGLGDAITLVHANANFQTMFGLIELVRQFADEETGLPMIAQGQQSPAITKTAEGMTLLMNQANVVPRRLVKEFDDGITSRHLGRWYRWNMHYHDDPSIKGDFEIVALGSSALMLREQQARQLLQLSQVAATNPEFARRTKWGDLYASIVQSMSLNASRVLIDEEEIKAQDAAMREQGPQMDPAAQVAMAKIQLDQLRFKLDAARQEHELARDAAELELRGREQQADFAELQARAMEVREAAMLRWREAQLQAQTDAADIQARVYVAMSKLSDERQREAARLALQERLKLLGIENENQRFNAEAALRLNTGEGI